MPKEICYYCNIDQRLDEECLSILMTRFRQQFQDYMRFNNNPSEDSHYRKTLDRFWESKKKDCTIILIAKEGIVGRENVFICQEHLEEVKESLR